MSQPGSASKGRHRPGSPEAARWKNAFDRHLAPTSPQPIGIVVDRAEGPWVFAADGRRYIDLLAGIGVANVGHTHPEVVRAVERQNRRHHHVMVYGEYVQEEQALYAEALAGAAPGDLDTVYFVNSGAEAVEGALKLARKATGRSEFVAFGGAYHGDTLGALSVAGNSVYKDPFEPLLGPVTILPFGDGDSLDAVDGSVAAVIVEPVQGEGGVRVPPADFLPALSARCRETGALLVLDEVMTGFGRTGRLFACEHWDVVPDVLVLAKALGGGYPLGAFVASRSLLSVLADDPPLSHVTTFGGHPVSCAAGRAALDVIRYQGLCDRAARVGDGFRRRLKESLPMAAPPTPGQGRTSGSESAMAGTLRDIRGLGLFIGIEFDTPQHTRAFVDGCRDRGVLLGWTLHHDTVVRLCPPLTIPEEVLEEAAGIMAEAASSLAG
jgi:acetylornithine/succinyldiaminopimelate/putrescine aminotransferase